MRKKYILLFSLLTVWTGSTATTYASPMGSAFSDFSAYTSNSVGDLSSSFRGRIDGNVAVGGNWNSKNVSVTGNVIAGGNVSFKGGHYGSVSAAGNVSMKNFSVAGDVSSGGSIYGSRGGRIGGNVSASGQVSLPHSIHVAGSVMGGAAYTAPVDFNATTSFFQDASSQIGSMAGTGSFTNTYGKLTFQAQSGINVINVDANELKNAWGVTITGPDDAIILINVDGETIALDSTNWNYLGGLTAGDVLLNFEQAEDFELTGMNEVNILAPNAETDFAYGQLSGSLIVGDLTGSGYITGGGFEHGDIFDGGGNPPAVPEPLTLFGLTAGVLTVGIRLRQRITT